MTKSQRKVASLASLGIENVELQLPSQQGTDEIVILRRPDLFSLIKSSENGQAPDFLTAFITSKMGMNEATVSQDDLVSGMGDLINTLAAAAFVEPALSPEQASRLELNDRLFIFGWAMGDRFQRANPLPEQQGNGVHAVPTV